MAPGRKKTARGSHVGYGQKLRVHRRADVRVLKAQLDLIAQVIRSSRFTAPVLALAIAFAGSDLFGYFGHCPANAAIALPAVITALILLSYQATLQYQREVTSPAQGNSLE